MAVHVEHRTRAPRTYRTIPHQTKITLGDDGPWSVTYIGTPSHEVCPESYLVPVPVLGRIKKQCLLIHHRLSYKRPFEPRAVQMKVCENRIPQGARFFHALHRTTCTHRSQENDEHPPAREVLERTFPSVSCYQSHNFSVPPLRSIR